MKKWTKSSCKSRIFHSKWAIRPIFPTKFYFSRPQKMKAFVFLWTDGHERTQKGAGAQAPRAGC
ncbi:MAG: hypothetical protein KHX34_03675 [Clostridiales bacterium]|nr:hypothetical protein [Clostridiales bacterium]